MQKLQQKLNTKKFEIDEFFREAQMYFQLA